ncbi:hypothetical protein ABZW47_31220 [Streptomyces sp. NPDC004549]|uniref:hypothetical protein n=1 Tax=Streptomyces sp. NPDC004549 TaxID=3154283 RepID=UPI0033B79779
MPADHARKNVIRQRMARTGEQYRDAARAIADICALPEPPLCALHTDPWDCPSDGCPHRDAVHDTPEYRAWAGAPRPARYVCPGDGTCEDPDCFHGCNDVAVHMCWDCWHLFGVSDNDPADGSCPNGCGLYAR